MVEVARNATAILLASLAGGFVFAGLGSRAFMFVARLLAPERRGVITEAQARVGEVTFAGTFFLIFFGALLGSIAIGWTIAGLEPWLEWTRRFLGPAIGVALLLVFSGIVLDPDNFDFALLGDEVITIAMIGVLFVGGGWAAVWIRDRLLDRLPVRESFVGRGAAYLPAILLGFGAFVLLLGLIGAPSDQSGFHQSPLVIALFLAVIIVSLVDSFMWVAHGAPSPAAVRITGYALTLLLVAAGTVHLVDVVRAIVP